MITVFLISERCFFINHQQHGCSNAPHLINETVKNMCIAYGMHSFWSTVCNMLLSGLVYDQISKLFVAESI